MTSLGCAWNFLIRGLLVSFSGVHSLLFPLVSAYSTVISLVLQQQATYSSLISVAPWHPKYANSSTLSQMRQKPILWIGLPLTSKLDCCIYMLCSFLFYLRNELGVECLLSVTVNHVSFCTISDSPVSLQAATALTCFQWPLGTQTMLVSSALQVR